MLWIALILIIVWIVIWITRAVNIFAEEQFFYKGKKLCTKKDKPILYHIEFMLSIIWTVFGLAILFFFLMGQI
jgi:hypothetical protein